jgi:hypothetical protein
MWTNYRVVAVDNLLIGKTNQVSKLLAQSILTVLHILWMGKSTPHDQVTRHCPYYSIVMECHQPWYLMVQKINTKETLRENFARLIAMQDRLNPTPLAAGCHQKND